MAEISKQHDRMKDYWNDIGNIKESLYKDKYKSRFQNKLYYINWNA